MRRKQHRLTPLAAAAIALAGPVAARAAAPPVAGHPPEIAAETAEAPRPAPPGTAAGHVTVSPLRAGAAEAGRMTVRHTGDEVIVDVAALPAWRLRALRIVAVGPGGRVARERRLAAPAAAHSERLSRADLGAGAGGDVAVSVLAEIAPAR